MHILLCGELSIGISGKRISLCLWQSPRIGTSDTHQLAWLCKDGKKPFSFARERIGETPALQGADNRRIAVYLVARGESLRIGGCGRACALSAEIGNHTRHKRGEGYKGENGAFA